VKRVHKDSEARMLLLANKNTFYLVDSAPPDPCSAKTLLSTSPLEKNYKEFSKSSATKTLYMPIWTFDELLKCRVMLTHNIFLSV
jgi:hypothetical protein